jgi:hypothetical protein
MSSFKYPTEEVLELVKAYNLLVKGIDDKAYVAEDRVYGGIIRAGKGILVESLARRIIELAWKELGGSEKRLSLKKQEVKIPLKQEYVKKIKSPEVREYIKSNIKHFLYKLKTDVHVHIDGEFIIGVECKAYTENAMFKRILVDFTLFKNIFPNLHCVLFQLESQLGGDYSQPNKDIILGSYSTHTLLSYFDIDLIIITLLEGERKVDKPIHKKEYYKELRPENLYKAIDVFKELLKSKV